MSITDVPSPLNNYTTPMFLCGGQTSTGEECYPSIGVRVLVTLLLVVVTVVALLGNVLLCGIVYRRSAMRSGINLLLANVAMSDFLMSLLHFPLALVVLNLREWPFGSGFCKFNGFIFILLNCEKVIVLLAISVDRYFIIVKRCDTLTPSKSKILIVCSWVLSLFISLPPVFGWGFYRFSHGCIQCLVQDANGKIGSLSKSYIIFSTTTVIIFPAMALGFIYNQILRTVRRNSFRVQNHPPVIPTAMHKKGKYFIDYSYKTRTSTTILMLALFFLVAMLPLGIVNVYVAVNGLDSVDMKFYIGFLVFSYLHSAASPLLYYWRIKKYRESVLDLCSQFFVFPHCISFSTHRERRIRPHVLYQVETMDNKCIITEI